MDTQNYPAVLGTIIFPSLVPKATQQAFYQQKKPKQTKIWLDLKKKERNKKQTSKEKTTITYAFEHCTRKT